MAESIVQINEGTGKKLHTFQRTIGANIVEDEVILHGEQYLATYMARATGLSTATADSHLVQIMAGGTLNLYIRRVRVFQGTLVTTAALGIIDIARLTTAGTGGGAITPTPLDSTDAASGATSMSLPTVKGTEAAGIYDSAVGYYLQTLAATTGVPGMALVADFDFDALRAKPMRIAAGVANGMAVKLRTAMAGGQVLVTVKFSEANF